MNEQTNVRLITNLYEALDRGDFDAVLACLHPHAALHCNAAHQAGLPHGPGSWAGFLRTLRDSAEEISVGVAPFALHGDTVVTIGRYEARCKGSGRRIDSPLAHLWTIRDGLVVMCQDLTPAAMDAATQPS